MNVQKLQEKLEAIYKEMNELEEELALYEQEAWKLERDIAIYENRENEDWWVEKE